MIDEQIYDTAVEECIEAHVRITNLETITQALADELTIKDGQLKYMLGVRNALQDEFRAQSDFIDDVTAEYRRALDTLELYESTDLASKIVEMLHTGTAEEYEDWMQTQEDARNAGNP